MINLNSVIETYPIELRSFRRAILREYLQYKILSYLFQSKIAEKIDFIGGTAIRFLYNSQRFSEDLDFDNTGLQKQEFELVAEEIRKKLEYEGLDVEIKTYKTKSVFHYKIRLPGIYHKLNLSGHKDEVLLLKVDAEDQGVDYPTESVLIRKLDVLTMIRVSPVDVLLAQKIDAYLNRTQGRDIYDIFFLSSKTKPNYKYLRQKQSIPDADSLKERLLSRFAELDFSRLENDANRFLFFPERDRHIISMFGEFVKSNEF